ARPLTLKRQTARDSRKRSVAALSSAGVTGCVSSGALCGSASATARKERILFLTHESHPTPPGKKHYLTIRSAGRSGTGVCHARREHRVRQACGGSLGRRGQGLAYVRAEYHSSGGTNREVWRAQATFSPSDEASLPGDVEFALRCHVLGEDYWDNNESRNYFSNADSGVLLEQSARLLNIDFNPILQAGQRYCSIEVAVRHSLQPKRVYIHWTTDNWRTTQ